MMGLTCECTLIGTSTRQYKLMRRPCQEGVPKNPFSVRPSVRGLHPASCSCTYRDK